MPPDSSNFAVHPAFASRLAALKIDSPERVLDLPGEVVSGHPDRHVLRVELPGFQTALYLKRQHTVTRRERFRNWRAGFGSVSRCEREGIVLDRIAAEGLPAPRWIARGEDGRGRAFLLVEEVRDSIDLRRTLECLEEPAERNLLADRIGNLIGEIHRRGFTTPDLTAKHLLVADGDITPIDWQSARYVGRVNDRDRLRALAALQASVPEELASLRERLRVLHSAVGAARAEGTESLSTMARRIEAEATRLRERRSFRDQRAGSASQRLIWVAGEAVCAIPSVAANWPSPAIAAPFYGSAPGRLAIRLPNGQPAYLIRGRSIDPIGRFTAHLRGKSWRSPGVTLGRILFHLEHYGVSAPRLLAFGQRLTGPIRAEWFALHTLPPPPIPYLTPALAAQLGHCLKLLHDAGCRPGGDSRELFGLHERVSIRDVTALRLVKRLTRRDRFDDLGRVAATLSPRLRASVGAGYRGDECGANTPTCASVTG